LHLVKRNQKTISTLRLASNATNIFRKWNRIIHRDFGYFFFGITIIYCISGIAVNHKKDWNPNYNIRQKSFTVTHLLPREYIDDAFVKTLLKGLGENQDYKKFYFPTANELRIFLKTSGSVTINLDTKIGYIETISKRSFFYEFNFLHYNPGKWWTWFSDIFSGALILISISGLFIIAKGKNSLTRRGVWLIIAGLVLPILAMFLL